MKRINKRLLIALWLCLGLGLSIFQSPKLTFWPGVWLASVFLIRYFRSLKLWKAMLIAYVPGVLIFYFAFHGTILLTGPAYIIFCMVVGLISYIPFIADKLIYRHFSGFASTLVFPVFYLIIEYINSMGTSGTWGSIAYTQLGNLPLVQIVSITGIWGIVFLIPWFASVINWLWEHNFESGFIKKALLIYGGILTIVYIYGFIWLSLSVQNNSIRQAGIVMNSIDIFKAAYKDFAGEDIVLPERIDQMSMEVVLLNKGLNALVENPNPKQFPTAFATLEEHQKKLLEVTKREALAGAKIIAWDEGAGMVFKHNEDDFIKKAQILAQDHKIHLFMSMAALLPGKITKDRRFIENKIVVINPSGQVVTQYFKSKTVPDIDPSVTGSGIIQSIETEFGRITPLICYDADFPNFVRQAGRKKTDLLIISSGDWPDVALVHGAMAIFRAIENGTAMLRPVHGAPSLATDASGRILAKAMYDEDGEHILVAEIPMKRRLTLYPYMGDFIAIIICIMGVVMIAIIVIKRIKKKMLVKSK